ncbi:MAG: class I SAM-dependent methyltransferase, partial [Acidobacteriota bacterium]|nr:class I SAM-dependent methyltransferase [Acidobacteriota bacterium]
VPIEDKDVLDFGCGTGEITTQLAFLGARKVYALDVTPGLLDAANRRAQLDDVADRVESICGLVQDVDPRPVDAIVSFMVLHHCFPLENMMPALLRWLKPGGVFIAVEPVGYIPALTWLRDHSGIPGDPKDEGERKLNSADLGYLTGLFSKSEIVPFHLLGRLSRIAPRGDRAYRRIDRQLLRVPGFRKLAGIALFVGHP